ncbi:uncharacterized protein cd34 isoform X2 [Misgurnus anguillicaudatus]|uniref:uncharacterized protein cd34 isoform X2 n=1 Tax=Misgurnus anguillicaudatus TaxID=75329 RepID=UPI003CCF18DB
MAVIMKMNELWKMMTLGLIFCLLIQSCHGQEDTSDTATNSSTSDLNTTLNQVTNITNQVTNITNQETNTTNQENNTTNQQTHTTNQPIPVATTKSIQGPIQNTLIPTDVPDKNEPMSGTETPSLDTTRTITEVNTPDNEIAEKINSSSKPNKDKPKENSNEKSSAVFVSVLLTGLLLAAMIIGGFCYKSHRKTNNKGMKLAEESYMADEENQGNTLMSVAPLNQPEPEEKPSLNGESPEGVKTPTPPAATNGHSTTKTADTEL